MTVSGSSNSSKNERSGGKGGGSGGGGGPEGPPPATERKSVPSSRLTRGSGNFFMFIWPAYFGNLEYEKELQKLEGRDL